MIISFKCKYTEQLFNDMFVKKFEMIEKPARRKLLLLHRAKKISDLNMPIGNRPKLLKGNREGLYSLRINDQWRICFKWFKGEASEVEIIDYH